MGQLYRLFAGSNRNSMNLHCVMSICSISSQIFTRSFKELSNTLATTPLAKRRLFVKILVAGQIRRRVRYPRRLYSGSKRQRQRGGVGRGQRIHVGAV